MVIILYDCLLTSFIFSLECGEPGAEHGQPSVLLQFLVTPPPPLPVTTQSPPALQGVPISRNPAYRVFQ